MQLAKTGHAKSRFRLTSWNGHRDIIYCCQLSEVNSQQILELWTVVDGRESVGAKRCLRMYEVQEATGKCLGHEFPVWSMYRRGCCIETASCSMKVALNIRLCRIRDRNILPGFTFGSFEWTVSLPTTEQWMLFDSPRDGSRSAVANRASGWLQSTFRFVIVPRCPSQSDHDDATGLV